MDTPFFEVLKGIMMRNAMKKMVVYYLNIAKSKDPEMYINLSRLHLDPSAHTHLAEFQQAIVEISKMKLDDLEKMGVSGQFQTFWGSFFSDLPGLLVDYFSNERSTLGTPGEHVLRAHQLANVLGQLIAQETARHSVEDLLNRMGIKVRDDDPR